MSALAVISWLLLAIAALALLFWTVVMIRVMIGVRHVSRVSEGLALPEPPGGWPRVSVIVPAHNEEEMIDRCAATLRAQEYPDLQIVFVLDRCTDSTAQRLAPHALADPRVVVVENDACPEDWAGKCNAARLGAARATGDVFIFTDADTEFDPGLCRAAVALASARDAHFLSLLSTLRCERFHERVAQPVACIALMTLYPMGRMRRTSAPRPFANGQFMLFRRDWYERIGGHTAVKEALLEDMAFARCMADAGGTSVVALADGLLRCAMYDSLAAFTMGWQRIFMDACNRRAARLRRHGARMLVVGSGFAAAQVAGVAAALLLLFSGAVSLPVMLLATVAAGWLVQAISLAVIYPLIGAARRNLVWYPLGAGIVGRILRRTARDLENRKPVVWGGRRYVPEPR